MFGFEKLDAWKLAIDYADDVYAATRAFPSSERFGLTSQLRRSAVSIAANIAEGSGRRTDKDFARFIEIAFGSLMESISHIEIARRQNFVAQEDYNRLYQTVERLSRILSGLRNSLSASR